VQQQVARREGIDKGKIRRHAVGDVLIAYRWQQLQANRGRLL
jgi:hypothetical protein